MNHVYWHNNEGYLPVAIDNIMNHVYWQTRAVFTNVIGDSMNHVYWETLERYLPMSLIIL